MLAWLVSSLLLSCGPRLRKHELSSLCRMFMISMHNGKECWKGAPKRSAKICDYFFIVGNQQSTCIDVNRWVFYASFFFLLHKFLGCVILLFSLFFSFINCVIYVMFCSINLLFLVLFLVLHECYSSGVCCALWPLDLWCFVNIGSLVFCEH
jgi:hypothetical protein